MKIHYYHVDAFTGSMFSGNPAGVCLLESWLEPEVMQAIAAEHNLSETGFIVKEGDSYGLRWFTPKVEIDLCGHGTLAGSFVLFEIKGVSSETVSFNTKSGLLTVGRREDQLVMDFPAQAAKPCPEPDGLTDALGVKPVEVLFSEAGGDYLVVLEQEQQVRDLRPDMYTFGKIECRGIIVTAPGSGVDFVSRFFAPRVGIAEDPVTGSAHCILTPYWSKRLGKASLHALQVSSRGGELFCQDQGGRVQIAGQAVLYMQGEIEI